MTTNPEAGMRLAPCPFCGGPGRVTFGIYELDAGNHVVCEGRKDCPMFCSTPYRVHDTRAEAIAAWNTRAAAPVAPADGGSLREQARSVPGGDAAGSGDSPHDAVANLRVHQQQLDADGIMVGVSRQALDETLALIDRLSTCALVVRGLRRVLVEADGVMTFVKSNADRHYGSCEGDDIAHVSNLIKAAIIDADACLGEAPKGSVAHQIEMAVARATLNNTIISGADQ